ncbi:hypothetical protein INS49_014750 [Diaporthe citri]|uniref:uncharacterized protein n=1 Tax=Diaporthe citri TaxID=83186 RepID=UPI001C7EA822|nr:uncharacterized protein INS49_014750 [Diaporthe citri]KAG6356875.1 hypothetical protein INS49_014750 [Diaporthe citri]
MNAGAGGTGEADTRQTTKLGTLRRSIREETQLSHRPLRPSVPPGGGGGRFRYPQKRVSVRPPSFYR